MRGSIPLPEGTPQLLPTHFSYDRYKLQRSIIGIVLLIRRFNRKLIVYSDNLYRPDDSEMYIRRRLGVGDRSELQVVDFIRSRTWIMKGFNGDGNLSDTASQIQIITVVEVTNLMSFFCRLKNLLVDLVRYRVTCVTIQ